MSNKEYFSMLSVSIFTTEFVFLPMILVALDGVQAIFSLILLTILKVIIWMLVSKILMKYPRYSIFDIIDKKYNKYILLIAKSIYILYLTFVQVLMLNTIYSIINSYTLEYVSKYLIVGLLLLTLFYTIQNNMNAIFRMSKLVVCMLMSIGIILILFIGKIDYTNFFPMVGFSTQKMLYTMYVLISFFSGLECALVYTKFVKNTKAIKKIGVLSILCTQSLAIIFAVVSYGVFGIDMIVKEKWTLFSLVELLQIKVLSSTELIISFVSIFIILMVISIYAFTTIYCINTTLKQTNKNNRTFINLCMVTILFILTIYTSNKYTIYELLSYKQIYPIIAIILIFMTFIKTNKEKDRGED